MKTKKHTKTTAANPLDQAPGSDLARRIVDRLLCAYDGKPADRLELKRCKSGLVTEIGLGGYGRTSLLIMIEDEIEKPNNKLSHD